ncbi:MAG: NAD-dependent epimerase/dehydratase family protein [Sideroxyarcus sp.]|nr:NAD-dependent epimerase/dehydratase family protein [Sideroxyarcus sp.]
MKIFVTGGTGFIGSHLLHLLGTTTHKVTAQRRRTSLPCIDIGREPLWLEKAMDELEPTDFSGIDVFVHLASVGVSPKTASWHDLLHWNVLVMLDLLEKAHAAGVKRFVLAGSFAEYGLSADKYDFIPIDAPLLPTSPYAASKAAGFIAANTFAIEKNIELCYLRIFSAFGEGQYINNFWPSLRAAALSGEDFLMTPGGQVRDFVAVESVAEAFLRSIEGQDLVQKGVPFVANIGTGHPMSMLEFAEKCWTEWGAKGRIIAGAKPYRANEPMRFVPEIARAAN